MKKALLALWALSAFGAFAETYSQGYVYPIGPDFHYFNNNEEKAAMNINWPNEEMNGGCQFTTADGPGFGTAAVWFNNAAAQPRSVAAADATFPVVADPWNQGDYAIKMYANAWWGFGNFNFALPATDEPCRVRVIFRCETEGASDARRDNEHGILFRITNGAISSNEDGVPGPNAKVEIPDIWEHPELYRVVDLYTNDLNGQTYYAITFMPGGFGCGPNQPAFYLEEVSIVPTRLIEGDTHQPGDINLSAVETRPSLTVIDATEPAEPEYYVIKAGRGTPYLAYSEDVLSTSSGIQTSLHRTSELSEANIWEVTPGSEEGTLKITAYGTNLGLMTFVNANGEYYGSGAVATVSEPQDIYPVYHDNGTVSLCLNNTTGRAVVNGSWEYYTLDASNGSEFCGNWIPNDAGTNWTIYKLDMTNGVEAALEAVNATIVKEAAEAMVQQYIGNFNAYIENVPWVAEELQAGIDALKALQPTANYVNEITTIWDTACDNANATLSTVFEGKNVALRNLGKIGRGFSTNTLAVNPAAGKFTGLDGFSDPAASFVLTPVDGGYTLYNETYECYLSTKTVNAECYTTAAADSAQVIYPILHSFGGYSGIAFPIRKEYTTTTAGLNMQANSGTKVSFWNISGDCPIWSVVEATDEGVVKDAIETNIAALEVYVPNVPEMVADILNAAIDNLKALNPAQTNVDAVNEIGNNALAAANELLAGGMNGVKLSIKNLRKGQFLSAGADDWVYSVTNDAPQTAFTFKAQAEGGYILYNAAAKVYVGEVVSSELANQTDVTMATEEAEASVVYPFLCTSGSYVGVALALEANPTTSTIALNMNSNAKILHTYRAGDAGSIFALLPFVEVPATAVKLQGVVCNVGESIEVSAVVEPENATDQTLNWSSSNSEVASVDAEGMVWFHAAGNVTVTAECQGYEISVPFVVREVIARALSVFPVEAVGSIGNQFSLLALFEPENTTDKSIIWESSNPEIATVSEDGLVELLALGTTEITARCGELTAVSSVTVSDMVGLTEVASTGVVIDVVDGGIIVRNAAAGESVAVYTVDGKVANGAIIESEETRLNLAAGIYIVKVSPSTVAKVIIK